MSIITIMLAALVVIASASYNLEKRKLNHLSPIPSLQQSSNFLSEENQVIPTLTPLPAKVPSSAPTKSASSLFIYPNAVVVMFKSNILYLESTDDPDFITSWYKEEIASLGMTTKSFVTTKTNGNVLNKLVASDGVREIRVEITKDAGTDKVEIKILKSAIALDEKHR